MTRYLIWFSFVYLCCFISAIPKVSLIYFQFYLAHLMGFVAMLQVVYHIQMGGNARRMIVANQPRIASMCALFYIIYFILFFCLI